MNNVGDVLRKQYDMTGKKVVVTGGGSGIGRAIAHVFASLGATSIVLDRNGGAAQETVKLCAGMAGQATSEVIDLGDAGATEELFDKIVKTHGLIDVLVNSAALNLPGPSTEMDTATWKAVIDVNLTGLFLACRCAARGMIARREGSIINVASVGGLSAGITGRGNANASYRASKGGVVNLTRALAVEWAAYNVRVNAVAPGYVSTPMVNKILVDPELKKNIEARVPLGRIADPSEIAWPVTFLASHAASMITGQTMVIDGGLLA